MESKLLEQPTKFKVKIFGIRVPLSVKPLRLTGLLHIAKEAKNIEHDESKKDDIISVIGMSPKNVKPMARIVSIGILRSTFRIKLLSRLLSRVLIEFLTSQDLLTLLAIVLEKSDVNALFHATTLAKRIIPAAGVVISQAEQQPGDKLPDSSKVSDSHTTTS